MEKNSIHYGKLPLNVRLVFLLIGLAGVSAVFHAMAALMYQITFNEKKSIPLGLAMFVTIVAMSSLKKRNLKGYKKAIISLLALPVYYAYVAFTQNSVPEEAYKLIYSWPIFNTILYLSSVIFIANKKTKEFYDERL